METACSLLEAGTEFAAMAKSDYTALLFMLSKGMVRRFCCLRFLLVEENPVCPSGKATCLVKQGPRFETLASPVFQMRRKTKGLSSYDLSC